VRCRHCGIRFFAHPRCAGRRDLRCPFGCRQHHHRQRANERSRKHYQTGAGRKNKKLLNSKRSQAEKEAENASPRTVDAPSFLSEQSTPQDRCDTSRVSFPDAASVSEPAAQEVLELAVAAGNLTLALEGFVLDERALVNSRVLPYVQMVASVLEGRTISRDELIAALRNSMRQRSIARLPRREYVLRYLNQHPP
jgi:hypothetical protein